MHSSKYFRLFSVLMLVVMIVAACSPAPAATQEPAGGEEPGGAEASDVKVLVMATEGSVPTFDPLGSDDSRVDTPSINMYNALYQSKPGTTEIEPELALSYEVSEDSLTTTFTLRQGVKFHDGTELTAHDVKYTVDRMLGLKTGYYQSLTPIVGAEVIDDYTVAIKTDAPFPGLVMALSRLYIVNADLVKQHEENGDWGQKWLQDHEAGSGPYTLVSFEPEQQFTMEKFPDYFKGWEGSHADRVIFRVIKEEATRRLALENGDIDWAYVGSSDVFEVLKNTEGIKTYSDPTLNQLYFAFFNQNEYLKDARVRQAISLAYDYTGHVEQARAGYAQIARGPLPPPIPCFDEEMPESAQNMDEAKRLMAEAGYPDGGFTLTMAYQGTMPEEVSAFQIMQAALQELGITLEAMPVEWPSKVAAYANADTAPDIGTIWIYPSYPDPDEYLQRLAHSMQIGAINFSWYNNPEMDALLDAGRQEMDSSKRCEYYKDAQKLWLEDRPYADVVVGTNLAASRDYVEGYLATPSHTLAPFAYVMSVDGKYNK